MTRRTAVTVLFVFVAALAATSPALGGDEEQSRSITYSRDIAPIFSRRCESCHRPGEMAPMPLLNYEQVRPWLRSIRREVAFRRMPPWHADPAYGKFANDPSLARDEIDTILAWIDSGAPEGDPADLPLPGKWVEGWGIGEPDVVFEMPETFQVPASGVIPYKYYTVPTGFTEDRWVVRAEARPGNREVVHHILVFVVEGGAFRRRGRGRLWDKYLTGTVPGNEPTLFPPGKGKLIKAGSMLLFQVHYTANGKPQDDRSKVGLVFAREPIHEEVVTRPIVNRRFLIPPNVEDHKVEAWSRLFKEEMAILSLMPHMHLRGKSFEYRLVAPGGIEKTILYVPRYDFDWQHEYVLAEPVPVKPGWRIRCIARYDNSKSNPDNPDPDKTVRWGQQTWDEMMIGFVDFARPLRKATAVKSGREKRTGQF